VAVKVGAVELPVWVLAAAATIPLALVVAIILLAARAPVSPSVPASNTGQLSKDQLDALAHRAASGNTDALQRLEQNPPTTAAQWAAIGRGYAHMDAYQRSAQAYARALDLDSTLQQDETLLRDLYRASADATAVDLVLELAASRLGERGPDLIYDVWADAKSDPARAELAKRTNALLHTPKVRTASSAALRIAVDLWDSRTCEQYRELLFRAAKHADRRSTPVLLTLRRREGCGEAHQEDCFPCLRGNPGLKRALESAEKRMPPRL
jgi:hypothetical protein